MTQIAQLSAPEPGRLAAEALARRYDPCQGVVVEWSAERKESGGGQMLELRRRSVVTSDGRFAAQEFERDPQQPEPVDRLPKHFVHFDGRDLIAAESMGRMYSKTPMPAGAPIPGSPVHLLRAPWPVISTWARAIAVDELASFERGPGVWRATVSSTTDGAFTMGWSDAGEVLFFESTLDGVRTRREFSDFRGEGGLPIPRTLRVSVARIEANGPKTIADQTMSAATVRINPANIEDELRFDPIDLDANYFDRATGEIFTPDGRVPVGRTRLGVNVQTAGEISRRRRHWFYAGVGGAACASCAVAAWRVTQKRPT